VIGRVKTYEAIIKGDNIPEPGVPESFKVLLKEMQSLGLDMRVLRDDNTEVEITESNDYDGVTDLRHVIEGERFGGDDTAEFKSSGYSEQRVGEDGIEDVEPDDYESDADAEYEDEYDEELDPVEV
jgi:DNA-directed RNA polymerase subunit beta